MPTRRQQKVARVVKESVCNAINNHLQDPRIQGIVSVTEVDMSPDLRNADVYLSILAKDETTRKKTFIAIGHARTAVQSVVAKAIKSKFCPILHFHLDEKLKKTLETLNLIEQASRERKEKESIEEQQEE